MSAAVEDRSVKEPLDLIRLSLEEPVMIKCRGDRVLRGVLHAYDQHLNMVLSDVVEVVTTTEVDHETYEEIVKTVERKMEMLYVRGDIILIVVPQRR